MKAVKCFLFYAKNNFLNESLVFFWQIFVPSFIINISKEWVDILQLFTDNKTSIFCIVLLLCRPLPSNQIFELW